MKKIIFFMGSALLVLTACNSNSTSSTKAASDSSKMASNVDMKQKMEESNKQKAIASVQAFSNHDAEGAFKDATINSVEYGDGSMTPVSNLDSAKAGAAMFLKSFPDIKAENILALADGDRVAVFADWSCTFKNDLNGMKATGKTTKFHDCDLFKFNDSGKIVEHRSVQNMSVLFK